MDTQVFYLVLKDIISIAIPLVFAILLPVALVWLYYRNKKHETEKRTEIVLAALDKNPNLDVQEFIKALNPHRKPLAEHLLMRLHWELLVGWALTIIGALFIISFFTFGVYSIYVNQLRDGFFMLMLFFLPVFGVGVGLLVAAKICKKALKQLEGKQ